MSKQKKRVSLAAPPAPERETSPAAPVATSGPEQAFDSPPGPPPSGYAGEQMADSRAPAPAPAATQPGIETNAAFWMVLGSLTVGIVVLIGLLLMAPSGSSAAAAKPKPAATATTAVRAITSTPVVRAAAPTAQVNIEATITADAEARASVPRISLQETKQKLDAGQIILVDVRSQPSYNEQHIKGAINIPEADTVSRLSELPKDKEIVLYCA
jgi:hypothetical protein